MSDSEGTEAEELAHIDANPSTPKLMAGANNGPAVFTKRALTIEEMSNAADPVPIFAKGTEPKLESKQATDTTASNSMSLDTDAPSKKTKIKTGGSAKKQEKKVERGSKRTFQTLLTATKLHHLKKKDGEPFWRIDIQYEFLRAIFYDEHKVFTNAYSGTKGHTFADIYIDAMTRSSKCSKVLRDKMLFDKQGTLNMAMVCLLVNVGRMNTTLNFFPEMRAQLRTYHPIPCLQQGEEAKLGTNDYNKQLQDAPRLKSILKGACEDRPEPGTIDSMKEVDKIPHTNPINLVFLMTTFSYQVEKMFFSQTFTSSSNNSQKYEFFDLIVKKELSSASRAQVFLWLCWAFLETNLTDEELSANPFGPGLENGTKVPLLVELNEEQQALENVDPPDEIAFGQEMSRLRHKYLEDIGELHLFASPTDSGGDQSVDGSTPAPPPKRRQLRIRVTQDYSESKDGTETSKSRKTSASGRGGVLAGGAPVESSSKSTSNAKAPKIKATRGRQKRSREEEKREEKVNSEADYIIRHKHNRHRSRRYRAGPVKFCWARIKDSDPLQDSDKEDMLGGDSRKRKRKSDEQSAESITDPSFYDKTDWGEEVADNVRASRRALRWCQRWHPDLFVSTKSNTEQPQTTSSPATAVNKSNGDNKMHMANLLV